MDLLLRPITHVRRSLVAGSIREVVFGVEDGVTQNMILVAGMVGAQLSTRIIGVIAGINAIAGVLSMSMGTYLSSKAERDVELARGENVSSSRQSPRRDALVMAAAYALGASVPVLPFAVGIGQAATALGLAMLVTALALFALGIVKAELSHEPRIRSGTEMLLLASGAGLAGYLIGVAAQSLFSI